MAKKRGLVDGTKSFDRRLAAYSATAAAAMVVTSQGHAAVHSIGDPNFSFTAVNTGTGSSRGSIFSQAPFQATFLISNNLHQGAVSALMSFNFGGNALAVNGSSVLKLAYGAAIEGNNFDGSFPLFARTNHGVQGGQFLPTGAGAAKSGYLGWKLDHTGKDYYGWLKVRVTNDANGIPTTIAFVSSTANPGIYGAYWDAGDNIGAGMLTAVPEPSATGLVLLALGAVGVRELRRRRVQATP